MEQAVVAAAAVAVAAGRSAVVDAGPAPVAGAAARASWSPRGGSLVPRWA